MLSQTFKRHFVSHVNYTLQWSILFGKSNKINYANWMQVQSRARHIAFSYKHLWFMLPVFFFAVYELRFSNYSYIY